MPPAQRAQFAHQVEDLLLEGGSGFEDLEFTLENRRRVMFGELEKGNWEPVELDGQGAGLPDVVYRNKDTGQLLILEAKGGGSELGTRLSADQRMRVEQGTRAYLEGLARTMMNATSKKTQELGEELMRQLAKPDGVAPGVAWSTVPPFMDHPVMGGTSMATPQATGVHALLISAALAALMVAGLPSDRFTFAGFAPGTARVTLGVGPVAQFDAPGLLVALLMWTVKEPVRRGVARSAARSLERHAARR